MGDDNWLGGVYYVLNIIEAILSLPVNERPKICLIVSPFIDKKHYEKFASRVEILVYPSKNSFEAKHKMIHKIFRKIRVLIGTGYDNKYAKYLINNGVDIIYPTLSSLSEKFPIKWIAWIPDLQHKVLPEYFTKKQINDRNFTYSKISRDCQTIVFSSMDSQNTFKNYFEVVSSKCKVLHFKSLINEDWLTSSGENVLAKYNLSKLKYFIISNQWWVHKNHITVFKSVLELKKRGVEVIVVCTGSTVDHRNSGHFGNMIEFINENSLNNNIIVLGNIPRYDQIQLMRYANAVIQPSLFEGWSTVVEDARTLNKLIILSNINVNVEQAPPKALYFSAMSHQELAKLMEGIIKQEDGENEIDDNLNKENELRMIHQYGQYLINILSI